MKCIVQNSNFDLIVLTETWLKSEDEAERFQISGYTHYYNFRKTTKGGGVSIFVHNKLKHSQTEELCLNDNHFLWIYIENFSINIGVIYRKPESSNFSTFLDNYSEQLNKRRRTIVFGDFNLNLLSSDHQPTLYKDMLHEAGYKFINNISNDYCTRETSKVKTIIDHVCSNLKEIKFHFSLIDSSMSDHKQIYLEVEKYSSNKPQKIQYKAIDYKKLHKNLIDCHISNKFNSYNIFEEKLLRNIRDSIIYKSKILNLPRQDWINKTIVRDIQNRNNLWTQHKKSPNDKTKEESFIKKRNEVAVNIQRFKSTYYIKSFMACLKNPGKMWDLINDLSVNKIKMTTMTKTLLTDNGLITNDKEICNYFNTFFCSIGSNLAKQIPVQYHNNLTLTTEICATGSNMLNKFEPTNTNEVVSIINSLKCNVSAGLDCVNVKSIKCVKFLILDELTNCINKCLDEGTFPDTLKIAKVTPIHKSGNKSDPGNYRPISVLPILSKIFERILYTRLETYLNSQNFFYDKQYGFRPKCNTLSATIDVVTKIKLNIDNRKVALGIFIDLKKAFDTVSHDILLKKLKAIGISGTAFKMLKSYLTNRYQVVKIGETQSDPEKITYGVPQGSILGPLLFLIYINNIHTLNLRGDISLYADDTSLFYYGNTLEMITKDAQIDLDLLNLWFQSNLLTVNIAKTKYIIFAAKNKKISHKVSLNINNQAITKVDQEKYLGIILDNKMTWKPHIQKIKAKLTSLMGAIRSIVRCLPRVVRYIIYNSLIKPHIDYLIEIWGSASKTNLEPLQIAQNKLIKILFKYDFLTSTQKIYKETGLMNINQTYIYYNCLLVRKILNKDIHSKITFTKKQDIQKIKLRSANDIKLHKPRTNYGKKCIMFEGAQLYNKLPNDIKEAKSLLTFKKLLKSYLKNKI